MDPDNIADEYDGGYGCLSYGDGDDLYYISLIFMAVPDFFNSWGYNGENYDVVWTYNPTKY